MEEVHRMIPGHNRRSGIPEMPEALLKNINDENRSVLIRLWRKPRRREHTTREEPDQIGQRIERELYVRFIESVHYYRKYRKYG